MRRQITKKSVLDLNPNIGIGVDLPFNNHNVFKVNYTTRDQIRANILNFLLTNRNERVMNPNFGADLRSLVFSQIDDLDSIKELLLDKISLYFGNILVSEVNIEPDADRNTLMIHMIYALKNNPNLKDSIQINLAP